MPSPEPRGDLLGPLLDSLRRPGPCPAYLLLGSDPEPHDCCLTKGHEGPHICDCGIEWEGQ